MRRSTCGCRRDSDSICAVPDPATAGVVAVAWRRMFPRPSIPPEEARMTTHSGRTRYGVVSREERHAMSSFEFVQGLVTGALPLNSMAGTLGYDIVEVSEGKVAITAEPSAAHLNPAGTVHGGLTATLLDSCMGLA